MYVLCNRLATIFCPTLVVHGTADRVMPVGNGLAIAQIIPGCQLACLKDVGHMFWIQDPVGALRICGEFLAAADAPRGSKL
jgi:3-oxoadipate enol-lactonase